MDFEIRPGLVLAIEPMLNAGSPGVKILSDHWTAVTVDGRPSVHFEHTIAAPRRKYNRNFNNLFEI
jgi:methionyl aminopeptidase